MLKLPTSWRYGSPGALDPVTVNAFNDLVHRIAAQGETWPILELFKAKFAGGASWSSSESWAVSDLHAKMQAASDNAPMFIAAFWDGCEEVATRYPAIGLPDAGVINQILVQHGLPYELRPPELVSRRTDVPIALPPPVRSLDEQARDLIERSLQEADRMLLEHRPRQAVQEILWLLETVSTGFQGLESGSGTVEGKYFNKIVGELRRQGRGQALGEILSWMNKLHGFLSSPTGGGVRHGTQLSSGSAMTLDEAHLYCNLTKSYIRYLLAILDERSGSSASPAA